MVLLLIYGAVARLPNDDDVLQRLARVETKIDILIEDKHEATITARTANEALEKVKVANARIKDIEDNQRWLWRTVSGAIILAAIAFVIKGGLAP